MDRHELTATNIKNYIVPFKGFQPLEGEGGMQDTEDRKKQQHPVT